MAGCLAKLAKDQGSRCQSISPIAPGTGLSTFSLVMPSR